MSSPCEVIILGPSSFQIAAELLRWNSSVAPQQFLPPLHVQNKYFSVEVQLRWDDAGGLCTSQDGRVPTTGRSEYMQLGDCDDGVEPRAAPSLMSEDAPLGEWNCWENLSVWSQKLSGPSATRRAGVLVLGGAVCASPLAPLRAPFYLFPPSADFVFRAVVLCVDETSMTPLIRDRWLEQCISNGFELIFHDAIPTTKGVEETDATLPSFEVIPPSIERRGITHHEGELRGSARVLQLIHNTLWKLPGASSNNAAAGTHADTQMGPVLVIGHDEQLAVEILSHIGSWWQDEPPNGGDDPHYSPPSSRQRRRVLRWVHAYGSVAVEVMFLPASIFCESMKDLLTQWLPVHSSSTPPPLAVFFIDGVVALSPSEDVAGGSASLRSGNAARRLSLGVVDIFLAHLAQQQHQRHGGCFREADASQHGDGTQLCWISSTPLHEAEYVALEDRHVESVCLKWDDRCSVDGASVSISRATDVESAQHEVCGWDRLHELLSLATQSICTPPDRSANAILCIPLSVDAAVDGVRLACCSIVGALGSVPALREASGTATATIKTKYYDADISFFAAGLGWGRSLQRSSKKKWATLLAHFQVVIFVGGSVGSTTTAGDIVEQVGLFRQRWAPLLDVADDGDEGEGVGGGDGPSIDRSLAIWLCTERPLDDDEVSAVLQENSAGGTFPLEIVTGPRHMSTRLAACSPSPLDKGSDVISNGLDRVMELLECTQWARSTLKHPRPDEAAATKASSEGVEAAAPEHRSNGGCAGSSPTAAAVDDGDATKLVGCEPPRHMFVDPDTLITVVVEELLPSAAPTNTDMLLPWMHKLRDKGHKLRRADRQRQALILAEALGEQEMAD